jgi:hypothetical protein
MEVENKQPHEELKEFLNSIPAGYSKTYERVLIAETKTTPYIFRNWRLGITKIPLLERSVMNKVSKYGYGKPIFKLPDE